MYTPAYAKNENEEDLKDFIRKNGFGIVVSTVNGKLWATHIPLILVGDKLQGHISRGNKQWRALPQNEEVMVIFQGPHTYISSSWYNHENVPSWNYIAVHVYGKAHMQSEQELIESLRQLTNKYEKDSVKKFEGCVPYMGSGPAKLGSRNKFLIQDNSVILQ
jgi:transcriptional regulator